MADEPELSEAEFVERFVKRMVEVGGTSFDDGYSIEDHARAVAPSYWVDPQYREDGPEACADGDMSYWGEC